MSSAGGSVGVRFFIAGGEVVARTFDQIRDSGRRMWQEIATGHRSAVPGVRLLNASVNEVKAGAQGLAAEAGTMGRALSAAGPIGIAAAVGIGAMVLALHKAKTASIDFGAEIGDQAENIKVSTAALQEWRFAVDQTGGSARSADAALDSFTKKFGGARAGFGRDLLPFQQLGFSQEDLQKFDTAEQMLGAVIQRISELSNEAEQSAIAEKLGLTPFLTLIRQGTGAIEEFKQRAHESGNVLNADFIVRAKTAKDRISELSGSIKNNLALAFSPVIPAVVALFGWLSKVVALLAKIPGISSIIPDAAKSVDDLRKEYSASAEDLLEFDARNPAVKGNWRIEGARVSKRNAIASRMDELNRLISERAAQIAIAENRGGDAAGGNRRLIDVDAKGESARQAAQQQKRFDQAMAQAQQKRLQAEDDDTKTVSERLQIGLERLRQDRASRAIELARQVREEEIGADQARLLAATEESARQAESEALARKAQREVIRGAAEYDARIADYAIDLLRISEQMSIKVSDRLRLQLEIYDAERAQGRAALSARLDQDPNQTAAQRSRLLAGYDASSRAGRDQVEQDFDGLQQAIHDATRNGFLTGLEDGPLAALESFFSGMGQHFADKAADRFSDRMQDVLVDLGDFLADQLKGIGGGGGGILGAIGSGISSLFGGGRAAGGGVQSGWRYGMAEHGPELAVFGKSGQVFDPFTTRELLGGGGGGAPQVTVHAPFSPTYNVQGSGPEIAALRQQIARDRAEHQSKTIAAVNDGFSRGMIDTKRK